MTKLTTIYHTDSSKEPIVINEFDVNPLGLLGKNATEFGEQLNESLVNILENFSAPMDAGFAPTQTPFPTVTPTPSPPPPENSTYVAYVAANNSSFVSCSSYIEYVKYNHDNNTLTTLASIDNDSHQGGKNGVRYFNNTIFTNSRQLDRIASAPRYGIQAFRYNGTSTLLACGQYQHNSGASTAQYESMDIDLSNGMIYVVYSVNGAGGGTLVALSYNATTNTFVNRGEIALPAFAFHSDSLDWQDANVIVHNGYILVTGWMGGGTDSTDVYAYSFSGNPTTSGTFTAITSISYSTSLYYRPGEQRMVSDEVFTGTGKYILTGGIYQNKSYPIIKFNGTNITTFATPPIPVGGEYGADVAILPSTNPAIEFYFVGAYSQVGEIRVYSVSAAGAFTLLATQSIVYDYQKNYLSTYTAYITDAYYNPTTVGRIIIAERDYNQAEGNGMFEWNGTTLTRLGDVILTTTTNGQYITDVRAIPKLTIV